MRAKDKLRGGLKLVVKLAAFPSQLPAWRPVGCVCRSLVVSGNVCGSPVLHQKPLSVHRCGD